MNYDRVDAIGYALRFAHRYDIWGANIMGRDYMTKPQSSFELTYEPFSHGHKERFSNKVVTSFLNKHKTIYTKTTNWRTWRWPADETHMKTYEAFNG